MVAKSLTVYAEQLDSNKVKIGTWACDVGDSRAKCRLCDGASFSFKKGKNAFDQHSRTDRHKESMQRHNNKTKQLKITALVNEDAEEKKVKRFEIDLTRRLDRHNVPFGFIDCLVDCLKSHLNEESKIVQRTKLSRSKAIYISRDGIGKTYLEETISKLRECDGFSIGFDESEMNKNHEFEVMVNLSMNDSGIELRHYRSLSLEGTDAETIVDTLTEQLDEDNVPWRQKLIAPMTDGCRTMAGHKSGVKKRLEKLVPQLKDLGSCNDHHIGNAATHGVETLDEDVKEALVNIYFDIGGAKGKGLKNLWKSM